MSIRFALLIISSLLASVSYVVYIHAIRKGAARPHRTTRFCTSLITILSVASLLAQGSSVALWLSVVFAIGSLIVFVLSIRNGIGGWSRFDVFCLFTSVIGILFWRMTSSPLLGLVFFISADLVGQIPMLLKTYRHPSTEVWTFYFLDVLASLVTLSAIEHWSTGEVLYPLYVVFLDVSIIYLILRTPIARKLGNMR